MRKTLGGLTLSVALVLGMAATLAQADFYVIPVPAGVGTRIDSVPYTITQPGFYYLGKNLTGGGITVRCSNVTLDLMGFTITGSGSGYGILISAMFTGLNNVEIRNGTVKNFYHGVDASFANERCDRIINIRAIDNGGKGIHLGGKGHIVQGCTLYSNDYGLSCSDSLLIHNLSAFNSTANISGTGNTLVDNRF